MMLDLAKLTPAQAFKVLRRRCLIGMWVSGLALALSVAAVALRLAQWGCMP